VKCRPEQVRKGELPICFDRSLEQCGPAEKSQQQTSSEGDRKGRQYEAGCIPAAQHQDWREQNAQCRAGKHGNACELNCAQDNAAAVRRAKKSQE
jgi:hypothetical protein